MMPTYRLRSLVHRFPGHAGWHFVTVDRRHSAVIKELFGQPRRGWGSIPVRVTLGRSVWHTSIFWVAKEKTFLMGLKKSVRTAEKVREGETIAFSLQIRDV